MIFCTLLLVDVVFLVLFFFEYTFQIIFHGIISAGLEPVLSVNEKSCIASYFRIFIKLKPIFEPGTSAPWDLNCI